MRVLIIGSAGLAGSHLAAYPNAVDNANFRAIGGWQPLIGFALTLRDTLDYWRGRAVPPNRQSSAVSGQ